MTATTQARTGPRPNRLLAFTRKLHLWTGIALGLVLLVEGLTGIYLVHKEDLPSFKRAEVSTGWLPGHYGRGGEKDLALKVERVVAHPRDPAHLVLAAKSGLLESRDGGASWAPYAPDSALAEVKHLLFQDEALWVGHRRGLAACEAGRCRAVRVHRQQEDIEALAAFEGKVFAAVRHAGVFSSSDGATFAPLPPLPGEENGKQVKVHALHAGETLHAATKIGLFALDGKEWRPAGLAGRDVRDVLVRGEDETWVTVKPREGDDAVVLVTRDGGIGWTPLHLAAVAAGSAPSKVRQAGAEPGKKDGAKKEGSPDRKARLAHGEGRVLVATGTGLFEGRAGDARLTSLRAGEIQAIARHGGGAVIAVDREHLLRRDADAGAWVSFALPRMSLQRGVDLGKLLTDLHTGKFFNDALWPVYDLGAVALVLFVVTGLYLWLWPIVLRRRKAARRAVP